MVSEVKVNEVGVVFVKKGFNDFKKTFIEF